MALVVYKYRPAGVGDIPDLMSIRNNVRENPLVHIVLTTADYVQAMTTDGRAWLCEADAVIGVSLACSTRTQMASWASAAGDERTRASNAIDARM